MNDWEDLLPDIAESFGGQLPYPETADDIRAAYHRAPQTVLRMADAVAVLYQDGTAQNPWGMLRYRVKSIPDETTKTAHGTGRDKTIERAEQWIRTAGLMFDRETELLDELYGDRGMLHGHQDTKKRILALWHELRPLGEATELEQETRLARYAEQRAQLEQKPPATPVTNVAELIREEIQAAREKAPT